SSRRRGLSRPHRISQSAILVFHPWVGFPFPFDYRADPTPRLGEADARWLDELLRSNGLR
ncbi:MAG: hypothetical protein KY475_18940, partial [Planctomycetes bacterium]|nr:hypothetical protein [Planctomycetota bacterium]